MTAVRVLVWSSLAAFVAVQAKWSTDLLHEHHVTPLRVGLYALDMLVLVGGGLIVGTKIIRSEQHRKRRIL